jgi:hypothetical protein
MLVLLFTRGEYTDQWHAKIPHILNALNIDRYTTEASLSDKNLRSVEIIESQIRNRQDKIKLICG